MTTIDPAIARRLGSALALASGVIVALQIGMACFGLAAGSYWVDEFYTVWIASKSTFEEALRYALYDVHPPLYYLIAHAWQSVFGSGEAGLRSLSVACASLSAIVFYFGLRPYAPPLARAVPVALMVTSRIWIEQSQNARMYALGFLEGVTLSIVFVAAIYQLHRTGQLQTRMSIAFTAIALVYSFTHFYMFLGACALASVLLLAMRSWRQIFAFATIFSVVPMAMLAFVAILRGTTAVDVTNTWFLNGVVAFGSGLILGLGGTLPANWLIFIAILTLVALLVGASRRQANSAYVPLTAGMRSALLLALAALLVPIGGIVISLVIAPSFSARNVATVAPFIWTALCLGLAAISANRLQFLGLCGAMLLACAIMIDRALLDQRNEDWRAAGHFIKNQPGCANAPLLAILRIYETRPPPVALAQARFQNAYYPGLDPSRIRLILFDGKRFQLTPEAKALIVERLVHPKGCQVLAQAVHIGLDVKDYSVLFAAFQPNDLNTRIRIRRFSPRTGDAFVFVVERRAATRSASP